MIMEPGQQLLLPVKPAFIWFSLVVCLILNFVLSTSFPRAAWVPDVLAMALVFWNVHQPLRVGIGAAFVFGLLMDVHETALLGQHALAYAVLSFGAIAIHRRVLWFTLASQALHVWPLFAVAHAIVLGIRVVGGGIFPGWAVMLPPFIESLLWPVMTLVLLAPQRRPPDPDKNRPL